ncbi:aliphatic sulfonate ABC transporter substrate-binding protein [Streptomyces hainanensis]|uniref:Putative aliphatic sulfonates-binding protein n=1 Tax=Streptomyces hainanensis TaxID=402648 RepID=A0A4R4SPB5_9ACTN|nr:aliphatic sulfonate ABC transporter substrate-binding protein [Streptomyces hainanensis]
MALALTACVSGEGTDGGAGGGDGSVPLRLDWAYYNPESLVIREQGWLEEELADQDVTVSWLQSLGSNKANENLRAGAVDFGSTAGTPALLARANGTELRTVSVYSQPEWSALVVPAGSDIASVADLAGRQIAATKGTDPYFFLLQALREAGLDASDVSIVNLQHPDGKTALERGQVDAWAGLDPYTAQTELEAGSRLLYRNLDFNSYGFLNVAEDFLDAHPDLVQTVVDTYERARAWILDHPTEAVGILAEAAGISTEVAERQLLDRTRLDISPVPGDEQRVVLERVAPLLVAERQVADEETVAEALDTLFAPEFATAAADR